MTSPRKQETLRIRAEDALQRSEETWRTIAGASPNHILLLDPDGTVRFLNRPLPGLAPAAMEGGFLTACFSPSSGDAVETCLRRVLETREPGECVAEYDEPEGGTRHFELRVAPVLHEGRTTGLTANISDVTEFTLACAALERTREKLEQRVEERTWELATANLRLRKEVAERMRAERRLEESLREQETLLQEVHHRVKNNLQVVSSLLEMSGRQLKESLDDRALGALRDIRSKVHAMALIHSRLYAGRRLDSVNLADYCQEYYHQLAEMYGAERVVPVFRLQDVVLHLDKAVPCGLVLNELITNVFRHAYPDPTSPAEIKLELSRDHDGTIRILVSDHGVGLPEGFDLDAANTLGLKLIRDIVRYQLHGELRLRSVSGTEADVEFKDIGE